MGTPSAAGLEYWMDGFGSQGEPAVSLAELYRAIKESHEGNWENAIPLFTAVRQNSGVEQSRARARQFAVLMRYTYGLQSYGEGRSGMGVAYEGECRRVCEEGLREYIQCSWYPEISHVLRTALGAFDYNAGDRVSAWIQFQSALDAHAKVKCRWDLRETTSVGFAHLYLGNLLRERGERTRAIDFYEHALKELGRGGLIVVSRELATVLLEVGGGAARARRVAARALKVVRQEGGTKYDDEYLRLCIAEAGVLLKDRDAVAVLEELSRTAVHDDIRRAGTEWLGKREVGV